MSYLREELDALPRKPDVVAIAEELGLATDGTRAEVTDRIIDHQAQPTLTPDPPAEEEVSADPEVEDERAHDEESGQFVADDKGTQPDEAYEPPKSRKLSPRCAKVLRLLAGSYLTAEEFNDSAAEQEATAALEKGYQPCIVEGAGNRRFDMVIVEEVFDASDVASDAKPDGLHMNLARRLWRSQVYPCKG